MTHSLLADDERRLCRTRCAVVCTVILLYLLLAMALATSAAYADTSGIGVEPVLILKQTGWPLADGAVRIEDPGDGPVGLPSGTPYDAYNSGAEIASDAPEGWAIKIEETVCPPEARPLGGELDGEYYEFWSKYPVKRLVLKGATSAYLYVYELPYATHDWRLHCPPVTNGQGVSRYPSCSYVEIFFDDEDPPVRTHIISPDLIAQQDTIWMAAKVKVHPTLQLAIDKAQMYSELNPATNQSVDLTCSVQVKSNLPFMQQVSVTPFQFTPYGPSGTVLQSYKYVSGEWLLTSWDSGVDGPDPGTGDVIPEAVQSLYMTQVNGVTGALSIPETEINSDDLFPSTGVIGDTDNHIWENRIRWHVGPINWCVTAGYYAGEICVSVYQN